MTDLRQSLLGADFNFLQVVAEKWGLKFDQPDTRHGLDLIVKSLLALDNLTRIDKILTEEELQSLAWLQSRGGKALWDHFSRRFGEIREMGGGRLEREQPYLDPISPAESLWYRALIARGFLETDSGPREFVFIPEDLLQILTPLPGSHELEPASPRFPSRKASAKESSHHREARPVILDQICTILAALRMGIDPAVQLEGLLPQQERFFKGLLSISGLVDQDQKVLPEPVRDYFELSRGETLQKLWKNWLGSDSFQDVELVSGLHVEGTPEIDSIQVREQLLADLLALDDGSWWSIESLISQTREFAPDLLRKSGDYQSWFIKDLESGEYLKGFEYWDQVEGALLRFLITGPLYWLGFLDLASAETAGPPLAFRISQFAPGLLGRSPLNLPPRKAEEVQIRAKGEIRMTDHVPHKIRYQVARFCDWFPIRAEAYLYALTPASLSRAEAQGLRVAHLLALLKTQTDAVPPNILAALERWEKQGVQASLGRRTILRLGSPQVLKALKKSRASRYILEELGPTAVIVKDGSEQKIAEALVELGFFLELKDQDGSQT